MHRVLLIGLAGLVGTVARFGLSGMMAKRFGESFPVGTLLVNLVGCFLAGLFYQLFEDRLNVSEVVRAVLMIGFLGGFTTFSAFGLQTFELLKGGALGLAMMNLLVSNVAGLFLVWVGYSVARLFF